MVCTTHDHHHNNNDIHNNDAVKRRMCAPVSIVCLCLCVYCRVYSRSYMKSKEPVPMDLYTHIAVMERWMPIHSQPNQLTNQPAQHSKAKHSHLVDLLVSQCLVINYHSAYEYVSISLDRGRMEVNTQAKEITRITEHTKNQKKNKYEKKQMLNSSPNKRLKK